MHVRMSPSVFVLTRVGIIVPRHGHTAVDRNRLKRRLKEILAKETFPPGFDVVLVSDAQAYALNFDELRARVKGITARIVRDQE